MRFHQVHKGHSILDGHGFSVRLSLNVADLRKDNKDRDNLILIESTYVLLSP